MEDAQVTPYGTRVYVGGVLIFDNLEGYNVTLWPPHNGYKGDVYTDADGVFVHDGNGWLSLSNGSRILPELTIRASIQNLEGIKLAATGFLLSTGEASMFNQKTWYSLYQLKTYSQSFNGNGFTGGKIAHGKFWSTKLAYAGKLLGIYQGYDILTQYRSGKLSFNKFLVEETSNVYSTLGGLSGAAWGVGWESGRLLTQTNIYHRQIFLRFIPEGRDGLLSTDR